MQGRAGGDSGGGIARQVTVTSRAEHRVLLGRIEGGTAAGPRSFSPGSGIGFSTRANSARRLLTRMNALAPRPDRWASRKDSAVPRTGWLRQRRRRFEEAASQAGHLFDELCPNAIGIARSHQMLDFVGDGSDDGDLRPKTGELKLHAEAIVVGRLQGGERGHVGEHRLASQQQPDQVRSVDRIASESPEKWPHAASLARTVREGASCSLDASTGHAREGNLDRAVASSDRARSSRWTRHVDRA